MPRIQRLPSGLINQIAAGEVVERPVSVVKELVENALDAGSSQITVEIREGGCASIRVTDNGRGIPSDEIETAFLRHATSKIASLEDLEQVMTLGFRGEALASIASVAQVEMLSKTAGALTGSQIEIHGGVVQSMQEAGCPEGTTIIVRNIFYNTPARFKFMKKPSVEGGYISDMVSRLALAHPETSFTFIQNGSIVFKTNGNGDLKTAIFSIYGREIGKKLIPVHHEEDVCTLTGYAGHPDTARGNRQHENFFLNGRYIKSPLIQNAVEEAYKARLLGGKFPFYVLHMQMPPSYVDVNAHPAKMEVRFSQEREVFRLVREAVNDALRDHSLIPEVREKPVSYRQVSGQKPYEKEEISYDLSSLSRRREKESGLQVSEALPQRTTPVKPSKVSQQRPETALFGSVKEKQDVLEYGQKEISGETEQIKVPGEKGAGAPGKLAPKQKEAIAEVPPFFQHYRIIGQIFLTYWLVEQDESLFLIDQHAAHERIYFEQLTEVYRKKEVPSQPLLQPVALSLTHREKQLVEEYRDLLCRFGYELEEFGEDSYVVRSVPFIFQGPASPAFIMEIIDSLSNAQGSLESLYDLCLDSVAAISCKAAVKASDRLSQEETIGLIEQLLQLQDPFTCPHGRPTIIELSKSEIARRFGRT